MGANEARHVLDMTQDLAHVLALELYTAAQALEYRRDMISAARQLAQRGDLDALCAKVSNAPSADSLDYATFRQECAELLRQLASGGEFVPAARVQAALSRIRAEIPFMTRDRAMDGDVRRICHLVETDAVLCAARGTAPKS